MHDANPDNMTLIVGLGNPGPEYAGTRHNFGFMVVNELARRWAIATDTSKFHGRFGSGAFAGRKVALLKPATFMNRSGQAVIDAVNFYKLEPGQILVVLDDLDLPVGRLRLRVRGSGGGHKGLTDVLSRLGTDQVPRLRCGIGSPPPMIDPAEYVLAKFFAEERDLVEKAIRDAADAIEVAIRDGFPRAMDRFNRTEEDTETKPTS